MRLLILLLLASFAYAGDVSANLGGGFSAGDDQDSKGHVAAGLSVRFSRFQFDYLKAGPHVITGSYVISGQTGRARPFFQIGGGWAQNGDSSLAIVFGAGATIDVRRSFFVRPQVRLYGHVGPTLTVVPMVGFGWRF